MATITKTQIEKAQKEAYQGFGLGRVTVKTNRERVEVRLAFAGKRDARLAMIYQGVQWALETTRLQAHIDLHLRALTGKELALMVASIYINKEVRTMQDVTDFLNGKPVGFSL